MIKKIIPLLIILFVFVSCASVHKKYIAKEVNKIDSLSSRNELLKKEGIIFSAEENVELASKYFGYIEIAIENNTENWVTIKDIHVDFENDNIRKNTKIISGKEFLIWKKCVFAKKAITDFNKKLVKSIIFAAGATMALTSDNKNVRDIGSLAALGSSTSMTIDEYKKYKNFNKLENAQIFPENHLLNNEITIPPGFFVRKFLVLNTLNSKIDTFYINYIYVNYKVNNEKEDKKIKLIFRKQPTASNFTNSEWMEDIFDEIKKKYIEENRIYMRHNNQLNQNNNYEQYYKTNY